jgi:predicted RNase H-like HicB family nuclease
MMQEMEYLAVVEYAGSGFSIYFPDLPGCTSAGRTLDEVRAHGTHALKAYLEALYDRELSLPAPSSLDRIRAITPERDVLIEPVRLPAFAVDVA